MGTITVLDEALINKIAAGEVIERPSSIIKECIENSLDAGATIISVELQDGGISSIKISDNGKGMDAEDAALCWERHATSKIKTTDDLFSIDTLGFRGEALASIAAVARLTITTCQKDASEGTRIEIEGGKLLSQKPVGCPTGTIIEVSDLFFNTPVRKKYLKTTSTELAHVVDIIERYALLHPQIHFTIIHNGKEILSSPSSTMKNNLIHLYGLETAQKMVPVDFTQGGVTVSGFISKPTLSRSDRNSISLFINNRYVKNKIITDALMEAYHTLLHHGRYPVAVLKVSLDPTSIDVNVHPTKIHIRLESESVIAQMITEGIREVLIGEKLIPSAAEETLFNKPVFPKDRQMTVSGGLVQREFAPKPKAGMTATRAGERRYAVPQVAQTMLKDAEPLTPIRSESAPSIPRFNVLGQVHKTYVLAEVDEGVYIIDQHIAEERVWYERFLKQVKAKSLGRQDLVNPIQMKLAPKDALVMEDNMELFTQLGFAIESFGSNSFVIRTVPVLLGKSLGEQDVTDILDDLIANLGESPKLASLELKIETAVAMMACKASIRAGDDVTTARVNKMVSDLLQMDNPYTCPHGRPVIVKLTLQELDKMFGRIE